MKPMSEATELHRDLGRLEGQIQALEGRLEQQNHEIASMRKDIRVMLEFTQEARGSWKAMVAMGGFAATVGALVGKFFPFIVGGK